MKLFIFTLSLSRIVFYRTLHERVIKLVLVILTAFTAGCYHNDFYQSRGYVFGTLVELTIVDFPAEQAEKIGNRIFQDFQQKQDQYHPIKLPGELAQLNRAISAQHAFKASPEMVRLLQWSKIYADKSQGLFNPAIGCLIKTWGFQREELTSIAPNVIGINQCLKAKPNTRDVMIDGDQVSSKNPVVNLDFGGVVKGWSLDRAALILREAGIKNALINIGGNILALGKNQNAPWKVGIQDPRLPSAFATLDLEDGWAIGTSGDYQHYFIWQGTRYNHIINPLTGYPPQNIQAATVLIPPSPNAGLLSDITSKPLFLANDSQRAKIAKNIGVNYYMVITDTKISVTQNLAKKLKWQTKRVIKLIN